MGKLQGMCFFWIVERRKYFVRPNFKYDRRIIYYRMISCNFCNEHSEKRHSNLNYFVFPQWRQNYRLFLSSNSGEEELKARGSAASFLQDYYFREHGLIVVFLSTFWLFIGNYNQSKKGYANGNITCTHWQTGSKTCHSSAEQTSTI